MGLMIFFFLGGSCKGPFPSVIFTVTNCDRRFVHVVNDKFENYESLLFEELPKIVSYIRCRMTFATFHARVFSMRLRQSPCGTIMSMLEVMTVTVIACAGFTFPPFSFQRLLFVKHMKPLRLKLTFVPLLYKRKFLLCCFELETAR